MVVLNLAKNVIVGGESGHWLGVVDFALRTGLSARLDGVRQTLFTEGVSTGEIERSLTIKVVWTVAEWTFWDLMTLRDSVLRLISKTLRLHCSLRQTIVVVYLRSWGLINRRGQTLIVLVLCHLHWLINNWRALIVLVDLSSLLLLSLRIRVVESLSSPIRLKSCWDWLIRTMTSLGRL